MPPQPETRAQKKTKNVLIVEDEESIRVVLRLALESSGYEATVAANGKEGLELLERMSRPCLILLDLMMPVMDGWQFMKTLETKPGLKDIPVVIVTAFSEKARAIETREVISKPVALDVLFGVVARYCAEPA